MVVHSLRFLLILLTSVVVVVQSQRWDYGWDQQKLKQVMDTFKKFDANKDGFVTPQEVRKKLNVKTPHWRMTQSFIAADRDNNGKIDMEEWLGAIKMMEYTETDIDTWVLDLVTE